MARSNGFDFVLAVTEEGDVVEVVAALGSQIEGETRARVMHHQLSAFENRRQRDYQRAKHSSTLQRK